MAITDNQGNPIDINNMDDITGPSPVEMPNYIADDKVDQVEDQQKVEDPKVTFDPATDDLLDPVVEDQDVVDQVEDEDQIEDQDQVEDEEDEKSPDAEFFSGVGNILKDKGIIDTDIQSEQDLAEAIEAQVQARLDSKSKEIEEYMSAGIPYQAVQKVQQAIETTMAIDEESISSNPEIAKALIVSNYTSKGMSEDEAENIYQALVDTGRATEQAIKAKDTRLESLTGLLAEEKEKVKTSIEQEKRQREENAIALEKSLSEGEILGRKVTSTTQERLKSTLNTVVGHDAQGNPLNAYMKYKSENPVEFERNLLYLFTLTEGFKNLKAFDRSAQTRVSKKFRTSVSTLSSGKSFIDKAPTTKNSIDMNTIDDIV